MTRTYALTIEIPPEIEKEIENLAEATGRSQSEVALHALQSYLEIEMWQQARMPAQIKAASARATDAKAAYVKASYEDDYDSKVDVQAIYSQWKGSEDD
jgi:predicted transcriptional regulator